MKPLILNIAVWPPVEYMSLLLHHPNVLLEKFENYNKQSYRNRYEISGPNGRQTLSIPVDKKGKKHISITECGISYKQNWQMIHWRSLETAYNSTPYFLYYKEEIKHLYFSTFDSLWSFAIETIELSKKILGQDCEIVSTGKYHDDVTGSVDLRDSIHPKRLVYNHYSLVEHDDSYFQPFSDRNGFADNLSVLDVIFNEGPAGIEWLKKLYDKIVIDPVFSLQGTQS